MRLPRRGLLALGLGAAALVPVGWWLLAPPATSGPPGEAPPPEADEAGILAMRPGVATLVRLAGEARIFVLVFPDLSTQAMTMNRVAALVEKAGFPRDRLVSPEELQSAILASGDQPNTWYLAHDYSSADLAQFFALAARGSHPLNSAEAWLGTQLARIRALAGNDAALLTIAADSGAASEPLRPAILRHEVAHGWYFTRPAFANRVLAIWRESLTAAEREAMLRYLGQEGYDTGNERLMANETMAYLAFTPDLRIFNPESLGISAVRATLLRQLYEVALRQGA